MDSTLRLRQKAQYAVAVRKDRKAASYILFFAVNKLVEASSPTVDYTAAGGRMESPETRRVRSLTERDRPAIRTVVRRTEGRGGFRQVECLSV